MPPQARRTEYVGFINRGDFLAPVACQVKGGTHDALDFMFRIEHEIERIVRTAFDLARNRRKKVTSVDKANVLSSSRLWRHIAERVAGDYPDVTFDQLLVRSA